MTTAQPSMTGQVPEEQLVQLFRRAMLIRRVEEAATTLAGGEVDGVSHYYFGQEVTAVGATAALEPGDWMYTTHRNRGHVLARGGDLFKVLSELLGKETGYSKGKGGNLHIAAPDLHIPLASAMLGGSLPLAVGTAMGAKLEGTKRVVLSFMGDGTLSEGIFYEAINLAVLWQVPVIFLCENNSGTPSNLRGSGLVTTDIAAQVATFNLTSSVVDGGDLEAVRGVVSEMVDRGRTTSAPSFIEARMSKAPLTQSTKPGYPAPPLDVSEAWLPNPNHPLPEWRDADSLLKLARTLLDRGALNQESLRTLDSDVRAEVNQALAKARAAAFPPAEAALEDVYA